MKVTGSRPGHGGYEQWESLPSELYAILEGCRSSHRGWARQRANGSRVDEGQRWRSSVAAKVRDHAQSDELTPKRGKRQEPCPSAARVRPWSPRTLCARWHRARMRDGLGGLTQVARSRPRSHNEGQHEITSHVVFEVRRGGLADLGCSPNLVTSRSPSRGALECASEVGETASFPYTRTTKPLRITSDTPSEVAVSRSESTV